MDQAGNKKSLQVLIHLIGWGIIFVFPFFLISKSGNPVNLKWYLGYMFVPVSFMTIFYTNYFLLIDRILFRKRLVEFIFLNLILVLAVGFCLHLWQDFHFAHIMKETVAKRPPFPPKISFIARNFLLMGLTVGLSVAIKMTNNWYEADAGRKELEKSRAEAELKNLKNQLNPHFLFNTLNNIYSLIAFSPEKAQHAVHELSRLLRYVLYENNQEVVPLMKEVDFVQNYIELMRIRLPRFVEVTTEVHVDSNVCVAPLLFISLIENAFKHGVSSVEPSYIHISLFTETDKKVVCRITNSCFAKDGRDQSGSGIGLENLRKRLELLYPGKYSFEAAKVGNEYVARLEITVA